MYRSVNGVSKDTSPALKKYEWDMMANDVTWPKYKNMIDVKACGCLIQSELLEQENVPLEEIDDMIRRNKWDDIEEELRRCRAENCFDCHRPRARVKLLEREIELDRQRKVGPNLK